MSYTQLRAFHAVLENGGFTAAAQVLNVSQSTITMQVRELEGRFSVELFHRKGRKIVPTELGRNLYEISTKLIQAHADSLALLKSNGVLESGQLRIAAVGPFHAADMASKFKTRYPGVEIELVFGNSQKSMQSVLDRKADIAILADVTEHPSVVMKRYSIHKVVVFVYRGHPLFKKKSITFSELEGEQFILRERGSTTRNAFETALSRHKVGINCVMEIGSREGVWKAVMLGLGIGVVADFEFVPSANLRAVEIRDANICTSYFIAYLKDRKDAPALRAFRKLVL